MVRALGSKVVFSLVAACTLFTAEARAWNDFGHMEVAAAAYKHLRPKTKKRVAELMQLNPSYSEWIAGVPTAQRDRAAFMRAATWPDAIKSAPGYKVKPSDDPQSAPTASQNIGYEDHFAHSYWHYVDHPIPTTGPEPEAPNAATQIAFFKDTLASETAIDEVKSYDLVWLLHLVGDVHQPLHSATRFSAADPHGDRGGNAVKITGNAPPPVCDDPQSCSSGLPNQLHSFFDDIVGIGHDLTQIEAAAAKLPTPKAAAAAIRDEKAWIQESFALAQSKVYSPPIGDGNGPFTITHEYQAAAYALCRQRIALAGARLANLLNDALGS